MPKFTPEEESAILFCVANQIPICCPRNTALRRVLVPNLRGRRALAEFANDSLGCAFSADEEYQDETWDLYLERTITWLDAQAEA